MKYLHFYARHTFVIFECVLIASVAAEIWGLFTIAYTGFGLCVLIGLSVWMLTVMIRPYLLKRLSHLLEPLHVDVMPDYEIEEHVRKILRTLQLLDIRNAQLANIKTVVFVRKIWPLYTNVMLYKDCMVEVRYDTVYISDARKRPFIEPCEFNLE